MYHSTVGTISHYFALEVTTFGGPFVGSEKWEGGVLGSDGVIYGMPQQSQQVLKIIPASVMNAGH